MQAKTAALEKLRELKQASTSRYEEIKALADEELGIDEYTLDSEALRTPRLHSRWLDLLSTASVTAKQMQNFQKKLYLERWKYYSGTATDKYYAEHGILHVKILKTELPMYLDADELLCEAKELLEIVEQTVAFCEKCVKEVSARTFHIKSAIEWRRFTAGG